MELRPYALFALCALAARAPAQVITASKILSGSGVDVATVVALDSQGNVFIAGTTTSSDFPIVNGLASSLPLAALRVSSDGHTFTPASLALPGVSALAASSDGRTLLAANQGSIYRSADGGATWSPAAAISGAVIALAIDPVNAANAYAVTAASVFYRSADGGITWHSTGAVSPYLTQPSRIVIDPQNPASIYAYFTNGFYHSADNGATWQQLLVQGATGAQNQPLPIAVAFAPSQPGTVYAITTFATLQRSDDSGATWQLVSSFATDNPNTLAVDPQDPNGLWFIDGDRVEHSADGGVSAQTVFQRPGDSWMALAIDPQNPSHIFAADPFNVYASLDGGATWNAVAHGQFSSLLATPLAIYAAGTVPTTLFVAKLDPALTRILFSTFIGPVQTYGLAIALDASGNALVTGTTQSSDFPTTDGALEPVMQQQAGSAGFAVKVRADGGALFYSTFLNNFTPGGAAFDSSGAAVIVGTAQPGLPASANAFESAPGGLCTRPPGGFLGVVALSQSGSAYVFKLSADGGSLIFATYLTGSCGDSANAVRLDSAGNAYITGYTFSLDFPVTPDAMTAIFPGSKTSGFLSELSPDGSRLLYSTFFGGGANNSGNALALDAQGNVYIAGYTQAAASPGAISVSDSNACPPVFSVGPPFDYSFEYEDAFVMKTTLSAAPAMFFATIGGECQDSAQSLAIDGAGNLWLAGTTASSDFPTVSPIGQLGTGPGAFVSEVDPTGSKLLFSTFTGTAQNSGPAVAATRTGSYLASAIPQPSKAAGVAAIAAFIDETESPPISIDSIAQPNEPNAVEQNSFLPPAIAPGQLVLLNGAGIGPAAAAQAAVTAGGAFPTRLGGVQVAINGMPAPLVSVAANRIECQAPFELAGDSAANIQVQYNGQASNTLAVAVVPQQIALLAVVNADGTPNSAANPAPIGSVVTAYFTGVGQTIPAGVDGALNASAAIAPLVAPTLYLDARPTPPLFLGAAPGESTAVFQLNFAATALAASLAVGSNGTAGVGAVASVTLYLK
jgi:uncharacterized protein (TIGR03437 family)